MAKNNDANINLDELGHHYDGQRAKSLRLEKLLEAIRDVPPPRLLEKPLVSGDELQKTRLTLKRPTVALGQDRCSRPRCNNKGWSSGFGTGVICLKHTEENLRLSGVPTLFNRNTYVCQKNKMRLEDIVNNFQSLRAHWQNCPGKCKVDSCPRLIGIPRSS